MERKEWIQKQAKWNWHLTEYGILEVSFEKFHRIIIYCSCGMLSVQGRKQWQLIIQTSKVLSWCWNILLDLICIWSGLLLTKCAHITFSHSFQSIFYTTKFFWGYLFIFLFLGKSPLLLIQIIALKLVIWVLWFMIK